MTTFSESWHRVASQRLCLRPGVKSRRQNFRGERWMVLENPFNNEFFRVRPAAYEFIARLRPDRAVEDVWRECLERFPDDAPGQPEAIQLLSQLYFANLLQYDQATDASSLFERFRKRTRRELRSRLLNVMFLRIPLLDPDRFLVRALPLVGRLISPLGVLIWLAVVGWALKLAADHAPALRDQGQSVLAPSNLFLLYVGLVIVKTLHELGHAFFCRKFGGEVHALGVMLILFTPVPYVDATSSWGFRERWKRALVGAAGMIVEVFVAALALFIWANTGQGALHSLAYNMVFIASVSTVVFNLNPLLRFDGYYILSDLLEIPNLTPRASQQLRHLAERGLFGLENSSSPARTRREAGWLTVYGLTSGVYRVVVFAGILLVVADQFLLLGLVMAAVCLVSWVTVPVGRFLHYLATSPRLARHRPRAVAVSAGLAVAALALLQFIPFPSRFRAPGVLQARQWTEVVNGAAGQVEKLLVPPGALVRQGQPLVQLVNPELDLEVTRTQAACDEVVARLRHATAEAAADVKPLSQRLDALTNRLEKLRQDQSDLVLRARHDGLWIAPELREAPGRWLIRGTRLGLLVDTNGFQFTATVLQEDADALFANIVPRAEVRLFGQAAESLTVRRWQVLPGGQRLLPSAALGWSGGGEVAVAADDPQGRRALEPFFEVRAELDATAAVALLHGRAGRVRFELPPEPLLPRWLRRLWQLLQKRYQW